MNRLCTLFAFALIVALPGWGQDQAGPQPKSEEEVQAIVAVQEAQEPEARIAAAAKLLKDFKDTEYKEFANYMTMLSYQQLNDFENMMVFGERTLDHNPDNVGVLLQLSYAIPTRTREFDLDKDEKLSKAEDFAKRSMTLIPNLPKMDPNLPDEQWLLTKKDFMSQANESLGLVALKRGNYDESSALLKKALDLAPEQTGSTFYYLAQAYHKLGKKDEALAAVDQSISKGGFPLGGGQDAAQDLKKEISGSS